MTVHFTAIQKNQFLIETASSIVFQTLTQNNSGIQDLLHRMPALRRVQFAMVAQFRKTHFASFAQAASSSPQRSWRRADSIVQNLNVSIVIMVATSQ